MIPTYGNVWPSKTKANCAVTHRDISKSFMNSVVYLLLTVVRLKQGWEKIKLIYLNSILFLRKIEFQMSLVIGVMFDFCRT